MANLLELKLDGELVAELPLVIHDQAKAWSAFQPVFSLMCEKLVGEFYETMRIACDPQLADQMGAKAGFKIDLSTKPKPTLYVPEPAINGTNHKTTFPGQ